MKDKDTELLRLTMELTRDFNRWNHLYENGGSDPFWSDGVNLNLVRNHIISDKISIRQLVEAEEVEMSLFGVTYPDIYFRPTPDKVPQDYMAKPDQIRQRAQEQIALYESDPNFLFILEAHPKVFPKGETKATKKAGLDIWKTCGLTKYRHDIERDDLVAMRRDFHEDYEPKAVRWAEGARSLRAFLEAEHDPEDNVVVPNELDEEEEITEEIPEEDLEADIVENVTASPPPKKLSLDQQIVGAKARADVQEKPQQVQQEQLTLF